MAILTIIFIAILGTIVGSFLNALSFRYNSGKSMLGRSMCFSCGHTLNSFDLIPILSFLFLFGKCRYCRSKISWQYPLVELVMGIIFVLIYFKLPDIYSPEQFSLGFLISIIFWATFLFIGIYDIRHKIVPNEAVYLMMFIGLSNILFLGNTIFWSFLKALILFAPFFLLWLLSRGRWMGLGDGKIIFALGLFLPIEVSVSAVILSFWIGSIYAVAVLLASRRRLNSHLKKLTMKSELPFVPFLLAGSFLAYVFSMDILGLSLW